MRLFTRAVCWICNSTGYTDGPLYREPCPNPRCPYVKEPKQ